MFYKVMKALSERYHLILIDILGMGASSRPDWKHDNAEEGLDYMVEWVEVWRQKMGDIRGFILAGHSFGGYISGHYAIKYKKYVKKLLMLSPFGVPKRLFRDDQFEEFYDKVKPRPGGRKPPKFIFKIWRKVWQKKWSPFGVLRKSWTFIQNWAFNKYAKKRIGAGIPTEELEIYKEYIKIVLLRKGSTEYALFTLFDHYFHSKIPLDDEGKLSDLEIPISFIYGDRDWMLNTGNHDVLGRNPFKGTHSHWHSLDNSDHNLFFDNFDGLVDLIFLDL